MNGLASAGADSASPLRRRCAVQQSGRPDFTITGFDSVVRGGTNWLQFDRTFQLSNIIAYNRVAHNVRAGSMAGVETGRQAATTPAVTSRSTA